jgi:hypothetical protein
MAMAVRPPIAAVEIPPPELLAGADALGELADDDDARVGVCVGTMLEEDAEVLPVGTAELETWSEVLLAESEDDEVA